MTVYFVHVNIYFCSVFLYISIFTSCIVVFNFHRVVAYVNSGLCYVLLYLFVNLVIFFCLSKSTENSKKRKSETSNSRCLKSYFWYELVIFVIVFMCLSMHMLDFIF